MSKPATPLDMLKCYKPAILDLLKDDTKLDVARFIRLAYDILNPSTPYGGCEGCRHILVYGVSDRGAVDCWVCPACGMEYLFSFFKCKRQESEVTLASSSEWGIKVRQSDGTEVKY